MIDNVIDVLENQSTIGFGAVPDELKKLAQWVLWKYETRDGKTTKIPYNVKQQQRASSSDMSTWCSFSTACNAFAENSKKYEGIGFVFSADDPYVGVDLDDCLENGELKHWARELVDLMMPTYTEVSPSGNGIKMWIRAEKTRPENRKPVGDGGIEIYDKGHYFTVTGELFGETATVMQDQEGLDQLMQKVWGNPKTKTTPQRKPKTMDLDDSKLLDIAMRDDKFNGLWFGNWESNTDSYNTNYSSQSEADLALCAKLAFYWGNDFNAIDRIFRRSGLYRPKWEREDYRQMTIGTAIKNADGYDPHFICGSDFDQKSKDEMLTAATALEVEDEIESLKGLVADRRAQSGISEEAIEAKIDETRKLEGVERATSADRIASMLTGFSKTERIISVRSLRLPGQVYAHCKQLSPKGLNVKKV